ncbi:hypothetical protein [Nocardioides nitrophenolicus]|uniref:hypothetical protein n=1 Tax=Nocardioides nitrophenolicus TaxID=60489 RepID=UPI00195682F5|nr:hypothetical protein [Nocardioides nitrophenolicus]MBM7519244.1 hypothetical protein [Nocardioides nitrophenolicus]
MDRPLGALTRLLAVLLTASALLAAPPARAEDPTLVPGSQPITLPADAPATFRLQRTATGSTFHVGLWYVGAGDSVGEGVRVTIGTTPADTGCGSGAVFRPTLGEPAPLLTTTVSTWTDQPDHPCGTAEELFVTVGLPSDPADRGRAATLVVEEEPPLSTYAFDLLREPAAPTWRPLAADPSAEPARAGTTPADAPLVAAGSHQVALRAGRPAVLAVAVGWDQSLRVQVDGSAEATVKILGPLLGEDVASSGPGRAQSHVTSYLHRDSFDPTRAGASLAGDHYVLVELPLGATPAKVTVTLAVDGVPGDGVPDYGGPGRVHTGTVAPTESKPTESKGDDGTPVAMWVGAGALAVLGVVVLTRRGARVRGR